MEETPGAPDTPEQTKKQRDAPVIAGNYQIGQQIGKGGFATVHKAINLITGEVVAAKRFDATQVSKSALATITEEADLIKTLNHPNIVRFIELVKKKDLLVLVLEFVEGGSVASLVDQYGCLPEPVCLVYAPQVLTGMEYLHQRGVIHRDIKGSNILITKSGQAKLADFGVSSLLNDIEKRFSVVGTPYWMPPEVVDLKGWHTQGDIWSFGCTVIEMLTGVPPHFSCPPMAAMFKIVEEEVPIPTEGISAELQDFLKQCFIKDFTARPPAAKLLTHQWVSRVKEAAIPTDLPAVQSRLRGMTLQIEEADANKLRERLDADALNYMKLRESAFVHNAPSLRASQRVPLGVALDAESARNEIKKLEAAVHAEEIRRAGAPERGNQPRSQTSPPSSARGSGSGAATISPSGSGVALAWKRADTMSKKDLLKERDSKDKEKEKEKGAKLTKEDSSSSVIGRVFGAKTVSSATAKEMKSSEKYKAKLAEVKAERDRLKKRVDEQEDELDKLRLALSKTRTELEEQRTKVTALHGALEHLVKKDEARERAATSHSSVNFKVEAARLALPIDRKESSTNIERKDSALKPTTPRTARDSTAPLKADIITPRAKDTVKRDTIVSPSRTQRSDASGLFGAPLEAVLERQRARHPELRVPQLIDAGLRFLIKHVSTEGLFRIGGTHNRIQELAAKATAGDVEFDPHEVPHNVSALVTKYLRELPEPLLTAAAYDSYITAIDAPEPLTLISNLVRGLPFSSQFLLRDLCRFCSMVAYNAEYNKMSLDNLGRVIGPNILIGPAEQSLQRMQADADAVARVATLLVKSWRLVFSHIADVPKEENFEFKFRTSHAKSVQGLTACTTRNDVIVWTWDSSGALCAWSGRNFEQLRTHQPDPKRGMVSTALAVGGEVWLAAERAVTVMDGETGQVVWEDTSPGTSAFGFALDGDNLWVATWPGIRCYSRRTRAVVKSADTTKELKVLLVAGGALWVAGSKSTVIYDCETLTQIREVKEHSRRVNAFVAIGPARFVSVSDDQKCIVWDATAKTAVKVLEGHEGKVMCAAHAPNASVFFTASWDTSVRVWDTQTLSCLRVLKGYHTDCISGLSAFWEPQLGDWLLWTSSWDKHICSFKITAPVPTKATNSGSLPVLSLPPASAETPGAAPVVSPGRSPRSKTVDGHGEGREKKDKSPRQHKHHEHKERSDTASAATLAPPSTAASVSASPSPSPPPPAAGAASDAGAEDDDLSVSYIDLQRKMKENEARLAELHAKKKALGEAKK